MINHMFYFFIYSFKRTKICDPVTNSMSQRTPFPFRARSQKLPASAFLHLPLAEHKMNNVTAALITASL